MSFAIQFVVLTVELALPEKSDGLDIISTKIFSVLLI